MNKGLRPWNDLVYRLLAETVGIIDLMNKGLRLHY